MTVAATTAVQPGKGALAVFSFSLFLSAACMFSVQPMAGKMLLPLVGGTPAGWVVAMAFFQVMLLAGYYLAHLLAKTGPRVHGFLYLGLLAAGAYFLPPDVARHAQYIKGTPGATDIFLLLTAALAVPFVALSTGASTLQRLFTATGHKDAKDPYFLYAASNLGSFGGLLAYPLLIEPFSTLTAQALHWYAAYGILALCVLACIVMAAQERKETREERETSAAITNSDRARWLALSFLPSSLLMGLTTYLTTDIISVPMIWVVPLGVYLLGFVVAFSRRNPFSEKLLGVLVGVSILFAVGGMSLGVLSMPVAMLHTVCFSIFVLYCDTRLAALRPPERRLSEYYLFLAIGGALGGVFSAFLVPHIFVRTIEYPLCILATALLLPQCRPSTMPGKALIGVLALLVACTNMMPQIVIASVIDIIIIPCVFLIGIFCTFFNTKWLGYIYPLIGIVYAAITFLSPIQSAVYMNRNFFGTLKVFDAPRGTENLNVRYFMHGTTLHGFQFTDEDKQPFRTAYYTEVSPLTHIFNTLKPKNVAVLGLGVGTINCYNAPDRTFTYVEIDPDVVDIAQRHYTFLDKCESAAPPRIIVGDGRLEIEKMESASFDMLVMDAFSSDSIPAHLLTQEAMKTYFSRMSPGGVIVVNITNRHFRLQAPIASTVAPMGMVAKFATSEDLPMESVESYAARSTWVVVGRNAAALSAFTEQDGWQEIQADPEQKPWTDDYTSLLSAIYFQW